MRAYNYDDSREKSGMKRPKNLGKGMRVEAVVLCEGLELHIMINRPLGWHTNRVEPLIPAYFNGLIDSMCLLTAWCVS